MVKACASITEKVEITLDRLQGQSLGLGVTSSNLICAFLKIASACYKICEDSISYCVRKHFEKQKILKETN